MSNSKPSDLKSSQLAKKVIFASQFVSNPEPETFIWHRLGELGIYDDDVSYEILMSDSSKEGDFRKVFCENKESEKNLPLPRFRKVWEILREGAARTEEIKPHFSDDGGVFNLAKSLRSIGQYSDKELLERYGPDKSDSETEKELRERSHNRNFIIFKSPEEIDYEMTIKMLREARRRELPKTFNDGSKTYILYKVGEFPQTTYDVCPVTGDVLLDDYSEKIGVKWDIPLEGRQFAWIMKDQGIEMTAMVIRDLQKIFKDEGIEGLKNLYPNISVIFEDLQSEGKLPSLKSKLSSREKLDPFSSSKRY